MKYSSILSFLTLIFGGALIYNAIFCAFNIYMNLSWTPITDKSQRQTANIYKQMATIYERDGYNIPVRMHLFFADTIVQIAGELNEETKVKESWVQENGPFNNRKWQNTWPSKLHNWSNSVVPTFDKTYAVDTLVNKALVYKGQDES